MSEPRRLYRDVEHGMVGGVAAGMAEYFRADPTVVRVIFVLVIIFSFFAGLIAYFALWLIIPPKPTGGIPEPAPSRS